MSVGKTKLIKDLNILTAMAAEMDDYLINDTLFRQIKAGMPKLTLGGYFLREHRLIDLSETMLDSAAIGQLTQAKNQVEAAITKRRPQFLQKKAFFTLAIGRCNSCDTGIHAWKETPIH